MVKATTAGQVANNPLRDKLEDDTLDLSLCQLQDVPVRDIAQLPKGTSLDLSNNLLTALPDNFTTLNHLVKLDLSKNQIRELPEYFGHLKALRHLDLYSNQLERLPISFCQLRQLRWLDLKGNPLVPAIQKAAGDCITPQDCSKCAKNVVVLMQNMQSQIERERQKQYLAEAAKKQEEEAAKERERLEKKAARERRREEAKAREAERRQRHNMDISAEASNSFSKVNSRLQQKNANLNNAFGAGSKSKKQGWCALFFWLFIASALVSVATGISLLWIYTGGKLDAKSIDRAVPVLQRDIEATIMGAGKKLEVYLGDLNKSIGPFMSNVGQQLQVLWAELQRRNELVAIWVNHNLGPTFCASKRAAYEYWLIAQAKTQEFWDWLRPHLWQLWLSLRPHFEALGTTIRLYVESAIAWLQENGPVYVSYVYETCVNTVTMIANKVDNMVNGQ